MSSSNHIAVAPGITGRRSAQLATLVVFVAFLDFFIGLPLVPTYADDLGASATMVGIIVAAYSITNLPGNVVAGYFLDRFGRRIPITTGLVVTALALAGYAVANSAEVLLAVRGLHGIAAAVLTPGAFAMLGDSTQQGQRARRMGRSAAGIAVAAVVGPASAGILADRIGYEPVFLIAAGLMAVTAVIYVIGSRGVGETPSDQEVAETAEELGNGRLDAVGLTVASVVVVALTIGIGTLAAYMPLHVEELGETSRTSGTAFTLYAVMALIMMVGAMGVFGDRFNRLAIVSGGLLLFGAGLVLMAANQDVWAVFLGMGVVGLGFGLLFPAAAALVADSGGTRHRGRAFGIFYGAYSLGVAAGAAMSGSIADASSAAPTGVPYLVAGILAIGCIVLALAAMSRGIGTVRREGEAA
ncbi:MAG: MFS transporter [Dehalococcoidia bacterium]|nr:MFS transporter [Dehalococcoidia bacterium]